MARGGGHVQQQPGAGELSGATSGRATAPHLRAMTVRADISPLSQLLRRVDAAADGAAPADAIATGFPSLDRLLGGGVRGGDLIVLGGDVGVGKSAFALAVALRAAAAGRRVELVTGEMDPMRAYERALAIEGRAPIDALRQGAVDETTRAALGAAALRMRGALPSISRMPPGGPEVVADALRRLIDCDLAIVDSLQCMPGGAQSQDEEMAHAMRELKRVAIDGELALLVTAHLPQLDRTRPDPRPMLDDFGALASVKQHADIVLALYREELYKPHDAPEGATELAVLKNRNGPVSYVDLYFYSQWLRFEDMVEPDR